MILWMRSLAYLKIVAYKGPFKNYVIPLLKVVFGSMCAKQGPFAAIMIQTTYVGVKPAVRIHSAIAAPSVPYLRRRLFS